MSKILKGFGAYPWGSTRILVTVIIITIIAGVSILILNSILTWSSDKFETALLTKQPFSEGGVSHSWYIAPMQGHEVQLNNGSWYFVHSDHWDSCEHNPNQGHLIGIGYTNKTAFDERVILDRDVITRNYTATFQTIYWVNASLVKDIRFIAW